jgi:CheY-like chemotaxis protein
MDSKKQTERKHTIVYVEDDPSFRARVRECIAGEDIILVELDSQDAFLQLGRRGGLEADLYVFDRHLPEKTGEKPNDIVWRTLAGYVDTLYVDRAVLILSNSPPRKDELQKYRSIKGTFNKAHFDSEKFKQILMSYLERGQR